MVRTITLVNKKRGTEASLRLDLKHKVISVGSSEDFRIPLSSHQVWRARRGLKSALEKKDGLLGESPKTQRPRQMAEREIRVVQDRLGTWVVFGKVGQRL